MLFDNLDIELYVDWLDKSLPESTNIITANKIKDKIKSSNKFLIIFRFVNWMPEKQKYKLIQLSGNF